ncbi:Zn-dependent peptidase [Weissella kandleri]|uniref:Zn-dependent peptidase n=1 Tax=Weissella kandleri TaxID=1616 RepID=A0A0R2JMG1_9LACO|nr:insulinase family protein [Weissella kandleri]KRN75149.1 Zn-dependent peptidase [Weissella kandleri]
MQAVKFELQTGINLTVISTQQFTTTQIQINAIQKKQAPTLAPRFMASQMAETVSAQYPTQRSFMEALQRLYGASLNIGLINMGRLSLLRISMELVNDKFATPHAALFAEGLQFIQQLIAAPLGDVENGYDGTIFEHQKNMAQDEVASWDEDYEYQAVQQLLNINFADPTLGLPTYNTMAALAQVTPQQAWQAWMQTWQNDPIEIVILGDVDPVVVKQQLAQLDMFAPRPRLVEQPQTQDAFKHQKLTIQHPAKQSQLTQSYHLPLPASMRFAGYVFNALWGGAGNARLFQEVREKAGLAYTIYSDYNPYNQLLMVVAGVDGEKLPATQQLIQTTLHVLQTELVSKAELEQSKQALMHDFVIAKDQPQNQVEREVAGSVSGWNLDEQAWMEAILSVTPEDILHVAQLVELASEVQLIGANENDE